PSPANAREKSDVITLVNGDRVTGEILELRYGQLSLKTDSLGTVSVDWLDIARIDSPHTFFVESNAGIQYSGTLAAAAQTGHIVIANQSGDVNLAVEDVAVVNQLESGFIERLTGSVSLGFDQTKSSGVSSLSFAFDTEYRSEKNISTLEGNYQATDTDETGSLSQYGISYNNQFLRPADYFWLGIAAYESNEQQGIDGRLLLGGARGKYWVRQAESEFSTYAGVGVVQEWTHGIGDDQQNVEGLLGLRWKVFRFKYPKTSLTSRLLVLPSLSESGRYRANMAVSLDREIVKDFYIDLSFNGSYDSDPPDETADTVDYSVGTSLKYRF
ncbi:MAG: DUF481 domain-containing protein, partial [Pseudomonadota bacterium]|nr:DUF481 domain-containing protein [Pseudomonadota bacterium]